ncbi:MAG: P22 phage major capsid protein family protein [Caldilineaceae bacterium]
MTINANNHADFIPEIWAAQALGYLKANTVMLNLVNHDYANEIAKDGDTINVSTRGNLTVRTKAAGTQVTSDSPTGGTRAITVSHKYISFVVEDLAEAQARPDLIDGYIGDGIAMIGEDIDQSLLNLYSGFSATPIDATTGIGADDVTEARRLLNAAKAPQQNRHIVWHEDAEKELLGLAQFTNAQNDPANATALQLATLGRKFGFGHYMDQQVVTAASECKNLAFHRDAMAFVSRRLPDPPANVGVRAATMVEDKIALRVLWGYSMADIGVQVIIDLVYGAAELRDSHAVVIRSTEL